MPPKVLLMGNAIVSKAKLSPSVLSFFEVIELPMQFPANTLDYLGDFFALLINHAPEEGEDGLATLKNIRQSSLQKAQDAEIVLIAQESAKEEIISAFRGDFFDFLLWPFEEEALIQRLERHLGKMVAHEPAQNKKSWSLSEMFNHFLPAANLGIAPNWIQDKDRPIEQKNLLRLQFFGPFEVFYDGRQLACDLQRKPKLLLSYMLFQHPKPVHRDQLMDWIWPDVDGDSARNSLNNAVFHIRRWLDQSGLGAHTLLFKDNFYHFKSSLQWESDVALFGAHLRQARQYEHENNWELAANAYHKAFAYYRAGFLEEWQDDLWVLKESDRFKEQYLLSLDKLSQRYFEQEQLEAAMVLTQRLLDADPLQEEAHRRLMRCYGRLGLREKAIKQFEQCKLALNRYLKTGPSSQTIHLLGQIQQQCA